ncbi:MAG TPA: CRISPR-associated helicase Cas3' [Sedimentisphaerales bacterium]|nr:CRISPR-associated helicase Cas3' [Sedimentisphaerales bacterium]HRS10777.1 CRISPR-associated helicase Cas3' [Sedimentisphaerales bacterium]HRV47482.1 CRISPR-associated helicase Cas3' [Sedimentisphaerales bacterium]
MSDPNGEYFAHSLPSRPRQEWQRLERHLDNVAELAAAFSAPFAARTWGWLAGLWHDIGKYSCQFQQRIAASQGEDAHIESVTKVDHSTAGAQHAARTIANKDFGKALAYVIAGHHGGLPDGIAVDSCLRVRLEKKIPDYSACPGRILEAKQLVLPFNLDRCHPAVRISLFIRMLYSALVDADFLDTERFIDEVKAGRRKGCRPLRELAPTYFDRLGALQEASPDTPVNRQRRNVLAQCCTKAQDKMGLFSLTVPTGGGKTLSSMAFALEHAMKHNLKRVIYVIPFTSIIEQNAQVFRDMLGEDAVLEHHSNFEPDSEDHRSRLAAENWDAPVVVTTNVQFFESLFANRSSRCRKLHNIAESVVILDEAQTLPPAYLLPCLEVLKELVACYKASIVLCSATQPAVQKREDFVAGLEGVREIVDDPQALTTSLHRTDVVMAGEMTDAELADQISGRDQVLCVVNTRRHARELYCLMRETKGAYHLSALMCPAHRSQKLIEIRSMLSSDRPCRLVSTQLIEAGVDIDFPVVFRSLAGIDSIAQAAGRCNREGKLERGQVFVFTPETGIPCGHFRQTAQAAESVIRRHSNDILSLAAIEDYFRLYYWQKGNALDEKGILAMLQAGCRNGDFPFKFVAEKFRFIENQMKPVIVPFDDQARSLIQALDHCDHPASVARQLQRYTVSVYPHEWDRLLAGGSIELKIGMFPILVDETLYRNDTGLATEDPNDRDPESLLI